MLAIGPASILYIGASTMMAEAFQDCFRELSMQGEFAEISDNMFGRRVKDQQLRDIGDTIYFILTIFCNTVN